MSRKISAHHQSLAAVPAGAYALGTRLSSKWWLVYAASKKEAVRIFADIHNIPTANVRQYTILPANPKSGEIRKKVVPTEVIELTEK